MKTKMQKSGILRDSPWASNKFGKIIFSLILGFVFILFLPWTQSIQANGFVTTLNTEERPQEIQSVIGGKISKWLVKEGDFVKTGDTIAILTEIKSEFLNPELLNKLKFKFKPKKIHF
jgi:multidrug efflux pump subunit AcrA (membrane-fusion protein)